MIAALNGMRVLESLHLVEDGFVWFPLGRSGWKVKRAAKVPYRGAVQLNESTLLMHPAIAREIRRQFSSASAVYER